MRGLGTLFGPCYTHPMRPSPSAHGLLWDTTQNL